MVESGPAAGVIAAANLGTALGHLDLISFDMGGTTAKVGLIQDGAPKVTKDYQVGVAAQAGIGGLALSGYPVRTPVIELFEIGAGGGSIAWLDSGGLLRVGPQSAGADPGPVCYGRGGEEPTVTDANLVLGRLNASYFLGGEIELDVDQAHTAIEKRCAAPLGLSVVEAAHGIVEIANAAMINALQLVSVQRGYDPRDFVLVAFGGAGPVHANGLSRETEIPIVLIPRSPGIFSATGLLVTDLTHDYTATLLRRLDRLDPAEVEGVFARLTGDGQAELEREGLRPDQIEFVRQVDMRYVGQSYELTVPLPGLQLGPDEVARLLELFHGEHDRTYGFSAPAEQPAELVNLRLTAIGRISKPDLRRLRLNEVEPALKAHRPVYFAESGDYVECPIYNRYTLPAGVSVEGPAIVEEFDSTTVLHPGYEATIDLYGNLLLKRSNPPGHTGHTAL
jgi:N-methylhydantoinase A